MAETIEELLVELSIDPASVEKLKSDIRKLRTQGSDKPIKITVETDATETTEELEEGFEDAKRAAQELGDVGTKELDRIKKAANDLKTTLLAIGVAGTAALVQSFRLAAEESRNLADASVILNLSQSELTKTQEALREIANEVGLSFQEVSKALFDVASAGIKGEQALEVVSAAARVAQGNNIALEVAFNAIATAMTNFGVSADVAADKLVVIGQATRGTVADVSDAIGRVGAFAAQFGIDFDTLGATFATLTSTGIPAAESITGMRQAFLSFIAPAENVRQQFIDLEITIGGTAFQTQSLQDKLEALKRAQARGVDLAQLFPGEVLANVAALIGNLDVLETNLIKVGNQADASKIALITTFKDPAKELDRLIQRLENAFTDLGDEILSALAPGIEIVSEFLGANRDLVVTILGVGTAFGVATAAIITLVFVSNQAIAAYTVLGAILVGNTAFLGENAAAQAIANGLTAVGNGIRSIAVGVYTLLNTAAVKLQPILLGEVVATTKSTIAWIANSAAKVFNRGIDIAGTILKTVGALILQTASTIASTVATFSFSGALASLGVAAAAARAGIIATATSIGVLQVVIAIGVIGAIIAFVAALVFVIDKLFGFSKAAREASEVQKNLTLRQQALKASVKANSAQQAVYNRVIQQGVNEFAALRIASDTYAEALFLISRGLSRTQNEQQRLDILLKEHPQLQEAATTADKEATKATGALALIKARLADQEEELLKVIKKVADDTIRIREGATAAEIASLREGAEEREKILRSSAELETSLLTANTREQATEQTVISLAVLQSEFKAHSDRLEEINQTIVTNRQNAADEIARTAEAQATSEIAAARRSSEERIKEERKAAKEIIKEILSIEDARKASDARSASFIERINQNVLRERDSRLAALRALELEGREQLKNAANETRRLEVLEAINTQIALIVKSSTDEARLREKIAAIDKELTAPDVSAEREIQLTEQRVTLQEELSEEQKITSEVAKAAADLQATANADSQTAAQLIAVEQEKLKTLRTEQIDLQKTIAIEEAKFLAQQTSINVALAERLRLAKEFAKVEATLTTPTGAAGPQAAPAAAAVEEAATPAQQNIQEQAANIQAVVANVGNTFAEVSAAFTALAGRFTELTNAQEAFANQLSNFGDLITDKITDLTEGFNTLDTKFSELSTRVSRLRIAGVDSNAEGAGL